MKKICQYLLLIISIVLLVVLLVIIFLKNKSDNKLDDESYTKVLSWEIYRKTDGYVAPKNNYSKIVLDRYNGLSYKNSNIRELFLTFDVGYESGITKDFLDIVNECGIKVAFFITNSFFEENPSLVEKMIDDGHIVGNHTMNHCDLTKLTEDEIKSELLDLHNKVKEKFDYEMKYFRPPEGLFSEKVLNVTSSIGYRAVVWGLAYDDWDKNNQKGYDYAKHMIFDNVEKGQVILLHANSKDNLHILKEFITTFQNKGYKFKSLDEY